LRPSHPAVYCSLAEALSLADENEEAQGALQHARELGPCDFAVHR
jgi:hypothetical protein